MRAAVAFLVAVAVPAAVLPAAPPRAAVATAFPGPPQPDAGTLPGPSRGGQVVAFAASVRENGDRYDPAATPTVLAWDTAAGTLRQLATSGPCDQPSAAAGAALVVPIGETVKRRISRTIVAFRSTANLAGKNADFSSEIFVWDSETNAITQVTDALSGASSDPVLGARFRPEEDIDGQHTGKLLVRWRLAFLSTSDLTGDNPGGLPQVFHYDSDLAEVGRLVQVSHSTAGAAGPPAIDGDGNRVAFLHDGGPAPGESPGAAPEAYLWDRRRGVRRATTAAGTGGEAEDLVLDRRGRYVAWSSTAVPAGPRRIFVADTSSRRLLEVGAVAGTHRAPALGSGAWPLLFLSTEPVAGPGAVPERPVLFVKGRGITEVGLPGGGWGRPVRLGDARTFYALSTLDLDGSNAAGNDVLHRVRLP